MEINRIAIVEQAARYIFISRELTTGELLSVVLII